MNRNAVFEIRVTVIVKIQSYTCSIENVFQISPVEPVGDAERVKIVQNKIQKRVSVLG